MNSISISSKADLLARTLAMLSETVERYDLFADQMEVVNNPVAEEIFKWLSKKQSERTAVVEKLVEGEDLPHIPPWDYDWDDAINTSVPGWTSAHYMMTPYHTLSLAMDVEQSAADFFHQVEQGSNDPALQKLAHGFAREAESYRDYLSRERRQYPLPEAGWDEDQDPPQLLE
ncbi:MAG: ferritin family protein [Sedimenticola sp.]|nr:ferritin family protein [Sedimenticola sp.]